MQPRQLLHEHRHQLGGHHDPSGALAALGGRLCEYRKEVPDPAGQPLDQVRGIRDDIDGRVRALLGELLLPA